MSFISPPSEEDQETASKEVREVALEISTIKSAIQKASSAKGNDGENTLKITALKISGLPDSAKPKINIQLSSPIESKIITKIYDPLDDEDENNEEIVEEKEEKDEDVEEPTNNDTVNESKVDEDAEGAENGSGEDAKANQGEEVDKVREELQTQEKEEVQPETSQMEEEGNEKDNKEEKEQEENCEVEKIDEVKKVTSSSSAAIFKGVDISVATLTIDVSDLDIPLGSSATYDVGPLCEIDVLGGVTKKITELEVAIVPDGAKVADIQKKESIVENESEHFQDAISEEGEVASNTDVGNIEESKDEEKVVDETLVDAEEKDEVQEGKAEETSEDKESDETIKEEVVDEGTIEDKNTSSIPEKTASVIIPTCILHLKIEYNAYADDQMLILKEKLNAAVARQAVAVDKLRKIAMAVRRAQMATAASSATETKKPAVKPGFLDKKTKKKEPMFLVRLYEKTIGPNSLMRQIYPIAKNYVLFFAGVFLMHYQGYQLALPPPV